MAQGITRRTCCLAFAGAVANAQYRHVRFEANDRSIAVSLIATDAKGAPVLDLKPSDLRIFEYGKRWEGTPEVVALNPAGVVEGLVPAPEFTNKLRNHPDLVGAIVFDGADPGWADAAFGRRTVLSILRQIGPEERVSVIVLGSTVRMVHDFTAPNGPLLQNLDSIAESLAWELKGAAKPSQPEDRMRGVIEALRPIDLSLWTLPGRKNVVWVGFPVISSDERYMLPEIYWEKPIDYYMLYTMRAAANNLAVYPIPLVSPAGTAKEQARSLMDLSALAGRTGGIGEHFASDPAEAVRASLADGRQSYFVRFTPPRRIAGGWFMVRIEPARKGLRLRFPSQYRIVRPPPLDSLSLMMEVLEAKLNVPPMGLTARIEPSNSAAGGDRLSLDVRGEDVVFDREADRWNTVLEVAVRLIDAGGHALPERPADKAIRLSLDEQGYRKLLDDGVAMKIDIPKNTAVSLVRAVVADREHLRIGAVNVPVSAS